MIITLIKKSLTSTLTKLSLASLAVPALARADDITIPCNLGDLCNLQPSNYIKAGVTILLGAAGIISFFFLLWGGIQWIMAGGDKEGTEKARKKITSALIGLAIVFSAYALLFIIHALFGVDVLGGFKLEGIWTY